MYETESDVEQKFVFPLLSTASPLGLGFSAGQIKTKASTRRLSIDKGASRKLYFPDYAIVVEGVPLLIVEAKAPGEDLDAAFREARLYAAEVNALYGTGLNPCSRVIATDGNRLVAGFWDQSTYVVDIDVQGLSPVDTRFQKIEEFASFRSLSEAARKVLKRARNTATFAKPTSLLGGRAVVDETVGENTFGANISIEYKYLFNPETLADRERIVRNAYVGSRRRLSHVAPIDKIIRAAVPPHVQDARAISDLSAPAEITDQLRQLTAQRNELCLLIGSVGSGKSTFTDYLRIEALSENLAQSTGWLSLNLNTAPLSRSDIYDWVLDQIVEAIKSKHREYDFDDLSFLKKLYAAQLRKVEKGRAALFPTESESYKQAVFSELQRIQSDRSETAKAYVDFFYRTRAKLPIVVLDNCDKRGRDDQLLMFEVASWLKTALQCTIFLPLRDTTYDQYRNEPPLDTVIKDLVFRIDPPLLERVIQARLHFALREIGANSASFVYHLPNGYRVECKRGDVADYLKSIISTLFQDGFFRRVVTGLAGRNIRKGLEIVLEFCKSGYISEAEILKIKSSGGEHKLPGHVVSKILLKGKRRYYSDNASPIRNLFHSFSEDELPNPFVRLAILQWLRVRKSEYGPNRTRGFHQVRTILEDLEDFGFSSSRLLLEMQALCDSESVISESHSNVLSPADLVSIAPAGFIHLDLVNDANYLSAAAEDVFFDSKASAKKVADNLVGKGIFPADSRQAVLSNASILLDFLDKYRKNYLLGDVKVLAEVRPDYTGVIDDAATRIGRLRDNDQRYKDQTSLVENYPVGAQEAGQVVSVQHYGFFVDFGTRGHGLVYRSHFNGLITDVLNDVESGDWVGVEILNYDSVKGRFDLKLMDI